LRSNTAFCRRETPSRRLARLPGTQYILMLKRVTPMADIAGADTSGAVASGAAASGEVLGGLRTLLRLEGLTLFLGMTLLYAVWGGAWWIYLILFLVPDLSFAAYLAGPKVGAIIYNAAHSYMAPMTLMVTGLGIESPLTLSIAMIWLAHIGFDRALGYGLKYAKGFGYTHLGRIGRTWPAG
jgi:Domain of unknown function (DUF4260)